MTPDNDNEYLDVVKQDQSDQATAIRSNASNATAINPDQEADAQQLARVSGAPLQTVKAQPEKIKQAVVAQNIGADDIVKQHPATGRFLQEPNNFNIASDNIDNMRGLEGIVAQPSMMGSLLGKMSETPYVIGNSIRGMIADATGNKQMQGEAKTYSDYMEEQSRELTPHFDSNLGKWTFDLAGMAPMLASFGISIPAGLAYMGLSGAGETYEPARAAGASPARAGLGSAAQAAVNVGTSFWPFKYAADNLGKAPLKEIIGNFLARDFASMETQGVASSAINKATTDPDSSWQDWATKELPGVVGESAFDAAAFGTAFAGIHAAMRTFTADGQAAAKAQNTAAALQALEKAAAADKLRARSPAAFENFIADAAKKGPVETLYVDPHALAQSGIDPAELAKASPSAAEQLPKAMESGGDLVIPAREFATNLAGTDLGTKLIDHLRADPDDMSKAQSDAFYQSGGADKLKEDIAKMMQEKADDSVFTGSMKRVEDDIAAKLGEANRFSENANRPYAMLASRLYGVQAAREGMTPEEFYKQYPLNINAEAGLGEHLDQGKGGVDPEFKAKYLFNLDKALSGHPGAVRRHVNVGFTSAPLEAVGAQRLPLISPAYKLRFAAGGDENHSVSHDTLENLPELLNDPVAVFKNTPGPNGEDRGLAVLIDAKDAKGNPVLVPIQRANDGAAHVVKTAYGRQDFNNWLARQVKEGRLLYRKNEMSLQLPEDNSQGAGSSTNILTRADLVKKGLLSQGNRGAYDPVTHTLSLLKSADLSTFLHETGHLALEMMADLANRPNASEGMKRDIDTVLKWTGEKGDTPEERLASWNAKTLNEKREQHEQFARGFEKYLFEGKAPAVGLHGVFQRFASWLKHVYRNMGALNVELDPDIRGVMDRMLATSDEIKEAEAARNFRPLFADAKAAGMTPEQFKAYQEESVRGTAQAQDQLQSRSLRDMQWLSNAKSGELRKLQKEARTKRAVILKEVRGEVMAEPVNRAREFFRKGEMDGQKVEGPHRLDIDDVQSKVDDARMSGDAPIPIEELESKFGKYGILGKGGMHPDTAAEMFGYSSGTELIKDLLTAEDPHEKINGITDQRMLERHGDLADPESRERAAEEAIHNEAHIKFAATEMHRLQETVKANKLPLQAAKQYAEKMIAALKVRDIVPTRYVVAGARASRNAEKAFTKGDHQTAALEKQNEVVQRYAAKEAYAAQKEVAKALTYLKRFDKKAVRENVGTAIEHIDALLDQYDLRKTAAENKAIRKDSLNKWFESQREAGYEPLISEDLLKSEERIHYKDMTVEAFRGLTDAVKSIEYVAKEAKTITHNGQKVLVGNIVNEFTDRMADRGERFTKEELLNPPQKGVDPLFKVALHRIGVALRLVNTDLRPTDYKADSYDMHELGGPFRKYIFDRVFDRNYWKTDNLRALSNEFKAKQAELGADWQKSLNDMVTNTTLADPDLSVEGQPPVMMKITRAKMIGIARHVGNESNFGKLTNGMKWKPVDVWNFLHENMREKDWKAVDGEWKSFEKFWPETEAMIRRLGGVVPEKIPLRPFETKFGKMDGGYAPIDYDPIRSKLSAKFGEISLDPTQSISKPEYYKATTTRNGSLNNRQEGYTDRLNLDYHYVTRRLNETIHDLAYREALIDAGKIVDHPKFKQQFMQTYGREEYTGLLKFFDDVKGAQMRDDGMSRFEHAMQYTRQGIVMTGVAYRLSTVAKHGTSAALKTMGYVSGGGQKYLAARVKALATGEREAQIADAQAKFPEIRTRMLQMDRDYKAGNVTMYEPESWKAKNDRYGHMLVAWSDALSAIPLAHASYDWATTEGIPVKLGGTGKPMGHDEAVRFANQQVREAHGSALESARSNFMRDRGAKSLLGIIYGFQNNTYGQLSGMIDQARTGKGDTSAILAKAMAVMIAPSIAAYYLSQGGVQDNEHWYSWMAKAITGEIASTVPLVREAWTMIEQRAAGRPVDPGAMPVLKMVADVVKTGGDAYDELVNGKDTKIIQDAANALGEWLHIGGLGQAGKTLEYVREVHSGKQQPESAAEAIQGATVGVHKAK